MAPSPSCRSSLQSTLGGHVVAGSQLLMHSVACLCQRVTSESGCLSSCAAAPARLTAVTACCTMLPASSPIPWVTAKICQRDRLHASQQKRSYAAPEAVSAVATELYPRCATIETTMAFPGQVYKRACRLQGIWQCHAGTGFSRICLLQNWTGPREVHYEGRALQRAAQYCRPMTIAAHCDPLCHPLPLATVHFHALYRFSPSACAELIATNLPWRSRTASVSRLRQCCSGSSLSALGPAGYPLHVTSARQPT